jgi:predicted porin
MNKKLIALAVGSAIGAFGASVAFAQSSVTLSGSLNFNYGNFDNGGAGFGKGTNNSVNIKKTKYDALSNQESEWTISGEEKLEGGMAAFFRCSTSMDITGGTAANMCARNSYIGLKGGFGSVNFGNYDTPAKRMTALFDPFPISAAMGQGAHMWNETASNTGNSTTSADTSKVTAISDAKTASFSRRQANLITYDMPTMNGFDASFAYSAANEASASTYASQVLKPRMWSTMAAYNNGPLQLGIAYENHHNYNPGYGNGGALTNGAGNGVITGYTGGDDTMLSLAAGYKLSDALRLSAIWNKIKYEKVNGVDDMGVVTWGAYADWNIAGPHRVRFGYNVQNSTTGTFNGMTATATNQIGKWTGNGGAGDTGAKKLSLEYVNHLSKRTEAGVAYARLTNDRFSAQIIGTGSSTATNFGETTTFMGVLIRHKF